MDKEEMEKAVSNSLREILNPIQRENDSASRQQMIEGACDALVFWLAMLSVERSLAGMGATISDVSPELKKLLVDRTNRIRQAVASLE